MDLPLELVAVFRRHPDARAKFDGYSPSHQREYIKYVAEAKKPKTRLVRADRVVMMLTGKNLATVYQPKTIPEVFGLKPDMKTKVVNQPDDYDRIMGGWRFEHATEGGKIDFAHLFVRTQDDLHTWLPKLRDQLVANGMIWVSWLKKSSGIHTDVTEAEVRDFAIDIGLVDIKVCAVSSIWSGLKLVIPVAKRVE